MDFINSEMTKTFAARYIKLCKTFKEHDKGITLGSKEIKMFDFLGNMKIKASEKVIYRDWKNEEFNIRLVISYGYGIISVSYVKWNGDGKDNESCHFEDLARVGMPIEFNRLNIKYPIAINELSFEIIMKELMSLHILLFPNLR